MATIILDCYTDEASGLGVPPFLGTYPRYLAGHLETQGEEWVYLTVDDMRAHVFGTLGDIKDRVKTDIRRYNFTTNDVGKVLSEADKVIVILGMHVPGKYLSAVPGTLNEVYRMLADFKGEKILTGPVLFGTVSGGAQLFKKGDEKFFDKIEPYNFSYEEIAEYSVKGAKLFKGIKGYRVIEIETSKGCPRRCSFCTEPLKAKMTYRKREDIVKEIKAFCEIGARYFRLGKQTDFYLNMDGVELLKEIRAACPEIEVLHIDNVNPQMVLGKKGKELTKAIVEYCTPGNIAAFGVESFDPVVVKDNDLVTTAEQTYQAIKIINELGSEIGKNGMPKYLPGINIIFGLKGESKGSNAHNMNWLKKFLDEGLLLRRINVRQVGIFEGTAMEEVGKKFLSKNKKWYWKWRNAIRQEIDNPMLKKLAPTGVVMKDVIMEIYDGNTTFGRQIGTYPLIIGVKGRIELGRFYDIKVTGHMLRSITGEVVKETFVTPLINLRS